jgi:hypothetical protein
LTLFNPTDKAYFNAPSGKIELGVSATATNVPTTPIANASPGIDTSASLP